MTTRVLHSREFQHMEERAESRVVATSQLEELYERYAAATYAFFHARTRVAHDAADLNQELYLRLSRSLDTYRGECSWRTWVFAIALTVLADHRRGRWRALSHREVLLDPAELSTDLGYENDPDREAAAILLRKRLALCLRRLDELARAVVIGHYFEGITLRELTEKLRLHNASGSRAVLIASQRKLRRCLDEGRGDD